MQNAAIATGESLYTNETGYIKPVSEIFTAWKCKTSFFLLAEYDQLYYGTADPKTSVKNEIGFLRADGVWDLVSLANTNEK